MLTERASRLAASLKAASARGVLEAADAISDLIPECNSGGPPPVRVEIGGPDAVRGGKIDLRVVTGPPAAAGNREDEAADGAIECAGVPIEVAALVVAPSAMSGSIHEAVIAAATAGLATEGLLQTAARLVRVPENKADGERMRLITPAMRRDEPEATEEYERWLEAACLRGIADRADGRYLACHDPELGGVPPPAYVEHVSGEWTKTLLRRYVLEGRLGDAARLIAGAPPNAAPCLRAAWRRGKDNSGVNPYVHAATHATAPAGIGFRTEPGTQIRAETVVALDDEAAKEPGAMDTAQAAALMRPRELFTLLWRGFEGALAAASSADNPRAAKLLGRLATWMIVPDERTEDAEPVFCEPPGLAPAVRRAFTGEARAYDSARDRAYRLARRQAADGRLLAHCREAGEAAAGA